MASNNWLALFASPLDTAGFILFVLVFPVYHALYPLLVMASPSRTAKARFDVLRRSWIEGLLDREDYVVAAQQTRNLTMVNTLLASSSLILMGFTANLLVRSRDLLGTTTLPQGLQVDPTGQAATGQAEKLLLLIVVFGVAFGYCMTSLRHLGHFNLVVGADRKLIESYEGSASDYLAGLINRASSRYTLATRSLYSASPLFLWLFDTWLFVAITLFWGIKFIFFQDFADRFSRRSGAA